MKLLLLLNEHFPKHHIDIYNALAKIKITSLLSDYIVYPFIYKLNNGLTQKEVNVEIIEIANKFQPTIVLWSHTNNLNINVSTIMHLKGLLSKPALGYLEGDMYHHIKKPLPKEMKIITSNCDVSFFPGYSKMIEELRRQGCIDMRYVPLATDEERFSSTKKSTNQEFSVVIVGNIIKRRIPWKSFPGAKLRLELGDFFFKKLGKKFASYGSGWSRSYSLGSMEFEKQGELYNNSIISLGCNNLFANYYYSNRLPISLSSGTIMLHNYEKGIEEIFPKNFYPYFFRSKEEAWEIAKRVLEMSDTKRTELEKKYRLFALKNLQVQNNLEYILKVLTQYYYRNIGKDYDLSVVNPWIQKIKL